jgi:hypothetical protein
VKENDKKTVAIKSDTHTKLKMEATKQRKLISEFLDIIIMKYLEKQKHE